MFNVQQMSSTEFTFVQTYVAAMRRDFELLRNVIAIMQDPALDVKNVVRATDMAQQLTQLHTDFSARLTDLAAKHKIKKRSRGDDTPTNDELDDIFLWSFFKLVKTLKTDGKVLAKKDDGWFSGDPQAVDDAAVEDFGASATLKGWGGLLSKFNNFPPTLTNWQKFYFSGNSKSENLWPIDDCPFDDDDEDNDWPEIGIE